MAIEQNGKTFTLKGLAPDATYIVQVQAVPKKGKPSAWSQPVKFRTNGKDVAPPAITNLVASFDGNGFNASWDGGWAQAEKDFASFRITITSSIAPSVTKIYDQTSSEFRLDYDSLLFAFLTVVNTLTIEVKSVDRSGNVSSGVSETVGNPPPAAPTNVAVVAETMGYQVSWDAPTETDYSYTKIYEASTVSGTYNHIDNVTATPSSIKVVGYDTRYVKVSHVDTFGGESPLAPSTGLAVTPINPVTVDTTPPGLISNATASFTDTNYLLTFNAPSESDVSDYLITLVGTSAAGSITRTAYLPTSGTSQQQFKLSIEENKNFFGSPKNTIVASIRARDTSGNIGLSVDNISATFSDSPPTPTNVQATAGVLSYSLKWDMPAYPLYSYSKIYESSTQNGSYSLVSSGSTPAVILTNSSNSRWVKVSHVSSLGSESALSSAISITPTNPVTVDTTAPGTVSNASASFIETKYTLVFDKPYDTDLKDFLVTLTGTSSSGSVTRSIYFPASNITQQKFELTLNENKSFFGDAKNDITASIQARDIYNNIGSSVSNINATMSTSISSPTNVQLTASTFSYTATWDTPTSLIYSYSKIYESSTQNGTYVVVTTGVNPVTRSTNNSNSVWVKVSHVTIFGTESAQSTAIQITPINPIIVDTDPPANATNLLLSTAVDTANPSRTTSSITATWTASTSTDVAGYYLRIRQGTGTWAVYTADKSATSYIFNNLTPNTSYTVEISAFDKVANISSYGLTQTITTAKDSTGPGAPTSLSLSALPKQIVATWSALSDLDLDKYQVQIDTANTFNTANLKTQETYSTTISFSSLSTGTTYYVRVRGVDKAGNNGSYSSIVSAVPPAFTSDGAAPSSSPVPSVSSGINAIAVRWSSVSNNDPVTYEVHVSTTSTFTPSASTKVGDTQSTFMMVSTDGSGTKLAYLTNYYFKIIAKDYDGSAAASSASPAVQVSTVGTNDVAANAITAAKIAANTITANEINTGAIGADEIAAGAITAVKFNATMGDFTSTMSVGGVANKKITIVGPAATDPGKIYSANSGATGIFQDVNTGFYLDGDGKFSLKDKLSWDGSSLIVQGEIRATSGYLSGALSVNGSGGAMKIGVNAGGTGNSGIYIDADNYWYSTGNFKVGTSSASYLSWNGTLLDIKGQITATGGAFTGNVQIASGAILYAGSSPTTGARVIINSTGITANDGTSNLFTLSSSGINAIAGSIAGWTIGSTTITSSGVTLDSANKKIVLGASNPLSIGQDIGGTGKHGIYINASNYIYGDGTFSLASGNILWNGTTLSVTGSGSFSGNINASGGAFTGNVQISNGSIYSGKIFDTSTASLTNNVATIITTSNHTFVVGDLVTVSGSVATYNGTYTITAITSNSISYAKTNANLTSASFAGTVSSAQRLILNSSGISGFDSAGLNKFTLTSAGLLTAKSGTIGGWTIGDTTLTSSGVTIDSTNKKIVFGTTNPLTIGQDVGGTNVHGIYIDATNYLYGNGKLSLAGGNIVWDGTNLTVGGPASFSGNITATGGKFTGDVQIDSTGLGGSLYVGASPTTGARVILNKNGLTAYNTSGTATFTLDAATGAVSISNYIQVGGAIAPGGAASDVNNNTTTISGNKIRTGSIESNGYVAPVSGSNFSQSGAQFDLANSIIRTKNFYSLAGSAGFLGSVTSTGLIVQSASTSVSYTTWSGGSMVTPSPAPTTALQADSGADIILGTLSGSLNPSKIRWIYNGQQRASVGFEVNDGDSGDGTIYDDTLVIRSHAVPSQTAGKILINAQNSGTIELKGNVTINGTEVVTPQSVVNRFRNYTDSNQGKPNNITYSNGNPVTVSGITINGDLHFKY